MFEFNARIGSSKVPLDGHLLLITPRSPGGDLLLGDSEGGQPLRQALPIQGGELNLGHIQPARVLGGVMHLKAVAQTARLGDRKDFIESRKRVGIEVIHHQDDLVGPWIILVGKPAHNLRPFLFGALSSYHRRGRWNEAVIKCKVLV